MELKQAVSILKRGGTAILPTDTVYGICCIYNSKRGVERIYREKRRPRSKPLPIIAGDLRQMLSVLKVDKAVAIKLSKLPVTLKGAPRKSMPKAFLSRDGKIAVRLVAHPFTKKVAKAVGILAATSANRSGKRSQTSAKDLQLSADFIADTGATRYRKPTTIVDVENLRIVRRGAAVRRVERLLKLIKGQRRSRTWKE